MSCSSLKLTSWASSYIYCAVDPFNMSKVQTFGNCMTYHDMAVGTSQLCGASHVNGKRRRALITIQSATRAATLRGHRQRNTLGPKTVTMPWSQHRMDHSDETLVVGLTSFAHLFNQTIVQSRYPAPVMHTGVHWTLGYASWSRVLMSEWFVGLAGWMDAAVPWRTNSTVFYVSLCSTRCCFYLLIAWLFPYVRLQFIARRKNDSEIVIVCACVIYKNR